MSRILVYTSPARGHLYPLVPTLHELRRRGHTIAVRTLAAEVPRVRALGFAAEPIAAAVEARVMDDWAASSPPAALSAACRVFADRALHEIEDLRAAIERERPDLLYVDVNSWGAAAAAEASGIPWATFAPYFLPLRAEGVPPWGLGLAPWSGFFGRIRDVVLWAAVNALYDRAGLAGLNRARDAAGVPRLAHVAEAPTRAGRVVAYTAEPFEYPRAWPSNVTLVGPGIWEPPDDGPAPPPDPRPLVMVTCSTEYQDDGRLIGVALEALAAEPVRVVATTAAVDPGTFRAPANARVERFLPHGPLLREAACVVCHGGMGITQKALAAGVPVCVVPFGRDQLEVARHVEVAGAGTRLPASRLTPDRLQRAIARAREQAPGARRIAEAFRRAGGSAAAADALERLVGADRSGERARAEAWKDVTTTASEVSP